MSSATVAERHLPRGLLAGERQIPLEGVSIEARLADLAVEVEVSQRYRNTEDVPIEAVYVFPLEEGASVCGFEARLEDSVVKGRVEEREKAFEIYDDAMADGHGTFLLDQERPNIFTASVGNLRPGEAVEICIRYVALARFEGEAIRLSIPTTVSPRYVPDAGPEVGQPDGERVNPERWARVPYGLELRVEVGTGSAVKSVESPSHAVRTELREDGATVQLSRRQTALDRDFVLLVETAEPHRPTVRLHRGEDGLTAAQLTFFPEFELSETAPREVIFLLDCSGSMQGDSIAEARRALALSVRALEEGDTFNIVRFGSSHELLWTEPRPYDEDSLTEATRHLKKVRANLGGTEILTPLEQILAWETDPERPRQVLLLTDGQVANEKAILQLARENASTTRIFTFGIGAGSSDYMVRGLARESGGMAEFIFPGERIEPKVLRMFHRLRSPVLLKPRIEWHGFKVEQAPAELSALFGGDALTVFVRIEEGTSGTVRLVARDPSSGKLEFPLEVNLDQAQEDMLVPRLWAREMIQDLERGVSQRRGSAQRRASLEERRRQRMVDLGREFGLLSSATSYLAVEERADDERTEQPAELRKIPIALTAGWGGRGSLLAGAIPAAPAFAPTPDSTTGAIPVGLPPGVRARSQPVAAAALPSFAEEAMASLSAGPSGFFNRAQEFLSRKRPNTPRAPAPAATLDTLYDLLLTQRADGGFPLSEPLAQRLGSALAFARKASSQHGELLVATTLVLALLERDETDRADEWRPAAAKARRFLEKQGVEWDPSEVLGASPIP